VSLPLGRVWCPLTERVGESINVFLVAENRLLREALGRVLSRKSDIDVIASVRYESSVVAQIADAKPHVVLLDSATVDSVSFQTIAALRQSVPGVRVVMIGMDADHQIFLRHVRAGVAGYLLKDASAVEIAAAVRGVAYDGAVCPPELCQVLFDSVAREAHIPSYPGQAKLDLTRREQQLAQMIDRGLSNKEIATQLTLSEQTVKNHIHRMIRKLGATDRLSAVALCRQHGLVV
jgi:DNA-binding NarL/FixJ family response regulator